MPVYDPVERVAARLKSTVEQLWVYQGSGWISIVEKDGKLVIRGDQEYKAQFILRLQQVLRLNAQEISAVLFAAEPPYSLNNVTRILAETRGVRRYAR